MAKTIFMIHGMWGGGHVWDHYKPFFEAQGYRVITPTLRFHEEQYRTVAPEALGTVSLLDYVADLEAQIRALDEKPILMGHSMGGLLAQILASRGLAQSLVLLTSAPPAGILALRPSSTKTFLSVLTKWGFGVSRCALRLKRHSMEFWRFCLQKNNAQLMTSILLSRVRRHMKLHSGLLIARKHPL